MPMTCQSLHIVNWGAERTRYSLMCILLKMVNGITNRERFSVISKMSKAEGWTISLFLITGVTSGLKLWHDSGSFNSVLMTCKRNSEANLVSHHRDLRHKRYNYKLTTTLKVDTFELLFNNSFKDVGEIIIIEIAPNLIL